MRSFSLERSPRVGGRGFLPTRGALRTAGSTTTSTITVRLRIGFNTRLRRAESQWAVTVDGYYAQKTRDAVLVVQRKRYVYPDGVYGPSTGWAMYWKEGNGEMIGKWR